MYNTIYNKNQKQLQERNFMYPISISFGELEYDSSDEVIIELTHKYELLVSNLRFKPILEDEEVNWQKEGF